MQAWNQRSVPRLRRIVRAIAGICFLGTPHSGSSSLVWLENVSKITQSSNNRLLRNSKDDSETSLYELTADFTKMSSHIRLLTCYETKSTPTFKGNILVRSLAGFLL